MDGFLDWYHGKMGIRVSEREERPQDRFAFPSPCPMAEMLGRDPTFPGDVRAGLGIRINRSFRPSFCHAPTPGARGVWSGVIRRDPEHASGPGHATAIYEASLGVGVTPSMVAWPTSRTRHAGGQLRPASSHLGNQSLSEPVLSSPYYHDTTLPVSTAGVSLDFGWILQTRGGGEWGLGYGRSRAGGPGVIWSSDRKDRSRTEPHSVQRRETAPCC